MKRAATLELPCTAWPARDRARWSAAIKPGLDPFDDCGRAAHLAEPTRRALQGSYGRYLGFISAKHARLLQRPPEDRLDRTLIADYVAFRWRCSASGMAIDLQHLRLALRYICPGTDWSWLLTITKRIGASAKRRPRKYHLVTSEQLYKLGVELMEQAIASAEEAGMAYRQ